MSVVPAAPQSAGFTAREQQFSPEGTAARQLSTAVFKAVESGNGGLHITSVNPPLPLYRWYAPQGRVGLNSISAAHVVGSSGSGWGSSAVDALAVHSATVPQLDVCLKGAPG